MSRLFRYQRWIRPGLALAAVCIAVTACLLLRPRTATAQVSRVREVLLTAPLAVARGQSAEIAFFLPAVQNQREPVNVRLLLLSADDARVLAQKDFVADRPGGGCLQLTPTDQQNPARQEVVGVLIALLRPGQAQPKASLQILDTDTQRTTGALPAVQSVFNQAAGQ